MSKNYVNLEGIMGKLRFGIIGVGGMGTSHVKNFHAGKMPNAEITAVCDVNPARLDFVRELYGDSIAYFADYKDLLNSGLVDAVLIATPHYLHPVIGIEAFNAGLHVLTEKPVGVYTQKVREFMEVAKNSGKVFGIMFNQRTYPAHQKLREIVQSGALGELKRCVWIITDWYRTQAYYDNGGWRATWSGEGSGVLINQCPHNFDLWQWIFGMPKRVRGFCSFGKYHNIEVDDDVTAFAEYENGATAVFISTTGECPGTNRLEISGSKGKIVYENYKLTYTKLAEDEREYCFTTSEGFKKIDQTVEEIQYPAISGGHVDIINNFTNHILNGEPLLAPGYEGINGLSISNAIMQSTWTNDFVDLPNDGSKFYELLQEQIKNSTVKKDASAAKAVNLDGTF